VNVDQFKIGDIVTPSFFRGSAVKNVFQVGNVKENGDIPDDKGTSFPTVLLRHASVEDIEVCLVNIASEEEILAEKKQSLIQYKEILEKRKDNVLHTRAD